MPPWRPGNPIEKFIDSEPVSLYAHNTLDDAIYKVRNFVGENLPVIDAETGRLQSPLPRARFSGHYQCPETGAA